MPVIYIDVLFTVNLIINYILLCSCCVFSNLKKNRYRMLLGSFVGAAYAVLVFFPDFSLLYSMLSKLLISMLIVAASFPFYTVRSYIKALMIFYMVSFGFGGCVLGVFYFSDVGAKLGAVYSNGVLYFNLPWTILASAGLLFYIAVKLFSYFSNKTYRSRSLKKKLYLSFGDKTAELTALLDTGNSLIDPITLSPVIIAEYKLIKNLFNDEIKTGLDRIGHDNITWIMSEVAQKGLPARLIPFSTIGRDNGMLLGFVPDRAIIQDDCGMRVMEKCVVGLYEKPLSKDRSYGALLNPYS